MNAQKGADTDRAQIHAMFFSGPSCLVNIHVLYQVSCMYQWFSVH